MFFWKVHALKRKVKHTITTTKVVRSSRHIVLILCVALAFLSSMQSCKDEKTKIMSQSQLEDVLFDYHMADAMVHAKGVSSDEYGTYLDAVLEKHGITRAEFDSTMVFYMKHAPKMLDVYKHLSDRVSNEARLQGVDSNNLFGGDVMTGDTANIWNRERAYVFTDKGNDNYVKFHLAADSTYRKGDRFQLSFYTDFIYQDGMRNGFAVMSVRLANDSVITRTSAMSSTSQYKLEVSDDKCIGIKDIRGFIMLRKSNSKADRNNSTLRMMIVTDIRLIRMHMSESEKAAKDSIQSANDNKIINNENQNTPALRPVSDTLRRENLRLHKLHSR